MEAKKKIDEDVRYFVPGVDKAPGILSLRPLWPCCELIPGLCLTFASVREILIRLFFSLL